jgi:hypothetical protein
MYPAMPSLAPWQRNVIALARGITLKASGQMKWSANIEVHGVTPQDSTIYSLFPIEADDQYQAARSAALSVAKAIYGPRGDAAWSFERREGDNFYVINIGLYEGAGVTRGRSCEVLVREYHGVQ